LKKNKLDIYKSAYKFLFVQDLVINYLTGVFVTDWTQASRSMLFNIDEFEWDDDFAKEVGIDLDKLPKTVPPGSIAGKLKNNIAKELGLRSDIPVIAAGGDQQCAAVGLGVTEPGIVLANTGTGSFVLTGSDNPVKDDKQRVICTASAVKGKWMLEASIFTTGSVYRWFRDNFSSVEIDAGKRLGLSPYDIMNTEVGKAPIGSNGLILIPHFAASAAPYWNPEARGILFGLELGHKRASIIRSFLEGISFEIQKNLKIMGNLTKEVSEVRVSGGMTKSSTFNQIQADIYGKDVLKTECGESSSLGAAILAANTIDLFSDIDDAVQNMVNVNEKSHKYPKKEAHEIYKEISELHDSIYKALNNNGVYSKAEKLSNTLNKQVK
jgi:xylulokinase/glycerol kinase